MPSFGRMAESRFHDVRHSAIVQPRLVLESNSTQTNDDDNATKLVRHAIRTVATNALDQVLGESEGCGVAEGTMDNIVLLFVRYDGSTMTSATVSGSYDVRPIFNITT